MPRTPPRSRRVFEARAACASVLALSIATASLVSFPTLRSRAATVAASASPSSSSKSAAQLKAEGDAAFDAFLYGDALALYGQAYELSHDPALLFNRGRALQALGRYPEALTMLTRFQAEAPKELLARAPGLTKLIADVRARVAVLQVVCNVGGAQVIVDDRVLGETGALSNVPLDAGTVILKVQREGYFPVRREVKLLGGTTTTVDVQLLPRATSGILAVTVDPPAARVSVDGKLEGNAPIELILPAGTHDLEVSSPGYQTLNTKAVITADARADRHLTLQSTPSITSRWWFWTGLGVVVVGGVVLTIALTTDRSPPNGTFSPPRVSAPLVRF